MTTFAAALGILFVALSPLLAGETATRQYVVVIKREASALPDPKLLGGRIDVISFDKTRLLVTLPDTAVEAWRQHRSVKYLQPIATGPRTRTSVQQPLTAAPNATTVLWDSGAYTYDGSGNIVSMASPTQELQSSFQYDRLNRLVLSRIGAATETFSYDPFGNLTASSRTGQDPRTISSPADATNNHLRDLASPNRFTYDAAGNLIIEDYGQTRYHYDAVNMLTSKEWGSGTSESYVYTPSDERIGVSLGGTTTQWHWILRDEDGKELREYEQWSSDLSVPWTWVEDHVYRSGLLLGTQRQPEDGGQLEFHLDHLGTPRMISTFQGAIISRNTYSPFGLEYTDMLQMHHAGADREEPLKFTGHHRDFMGPEFVQNENYLDYMHARYYEPVWGRSLSVDALLMVHRAMHNPQTWNRYSYVGNGPTVQTDPSGLLGEDQTSFLDWFSTPRQAESITVVARDPKHDQPSTPPAPYFGWGAGWAMWTSQSAGYEIERRLTHNETVLPTPVMQYAETVDAVANAPRLPDAINVSVSIGGPAGWAGSYSVDRNGNVYSSEPLGIAVGKSSFPVSLAVTGLWMNQCTTPSASALTNFLTGDGWSASGGYWIGGAYTTNSAGSATQFGFVTPQIGGSWTFSFVVPRSSPIKW